uniref:Serine esterase family protein n=2 Tax=Solanum TaxID=4107 RepID=M1CMJ3_SOLTU
MADLEEEMIEGLTQVPWERIDVSFHESRQRYVAHNTIQVKTYWLNSDGADVIEHMIDNFLL